MGEMTTMDDEFDTVLTTPTTPTATPRYSFLTGVAGSGKTYQIRQRIASAKPGSIVLSASTGIAALNMGEGVTTVHSLLKFFDYDSLQAAYLDGRLTRSMVNLVKDGVRELVIDEVSMFSGPMLDLVYQASQEAPEYGEELAISLTGDFCQLPPVKAPFAFEAQAWSEFAANTTRLTKVWRQSNQEFLAALNMLRRGAGGDAAEILRGMGVEFHSEMDDGFAGTTLRARNDEVDRYNMVRLLGLPGQPFGLRSNRWGTPEVYRPARTPQDKVRQPTDWAQIPDKLAMKVGARVMVLVNDTVGWTYVNGSTGVVRGLVKGDEGETLVEVELDNGSGVVRIGKIVRRVDRKRLPDEWEGQAARLGGNTRAVAMERAEPYYELGGKGRGRWILGEVEYFPLRLAWSSTIHKSQGLTLDRVQVDMRAHFFGAPAMAYTSLSRCKTPEGLRLVGKVEDLRRRANVDPKVVGWL